MPFFQPLAQRVQRGFVCVVRAYIRILAFRKQSEGSGLASLKDGGSLFASGLLCDLAGVTFFPHDLVAFGAADNILDLGLLMSWNEDEEAWLGTGRLVFVPGQLDPLRAVGIRALAEDAQAIVSISRKLGLQPLVNLAEHHFVQGKTLLLVSHPCVVA